MMVRVERIGDATLYLGDCREILPTLSGPVPVLVTDPVWPNAPKGNVPGSGFPWTLWREMWEAMPGIRRAVVVLRCDSDPRFLRIIPDCLSFFRTVQLPYVMPSYLGRVLGGDEIAYWFGTPVRSARGRRVIPGRAPPAQPTDRMANGHPMSRAQVHFNWLVWWCTDEDEVALDSFMGSGTTGVACARLGRKFIGIEIDETYFDIACRRIEAEMRAPRLPFRSVAGASQEAML